MGDQTGNKAQRKYADIKHHKKENQKKTAAILTAIAHRNSLSKRIGHPAIHSRIRKAGERETGITA